MGAASPRPSTCSATCWIRTPEPSRSRASTPSSGAKRHIGVCPQDIALYRDLRPAENLRFFAELGGLSRAAVAARVAELMRLFDLERFATTPVGALSGGWQRRVNIAVALVH